MLYGILIITFKLNLKLKKSIVDCKEKKMFKKYHKLLIM